MTANRTPLDQFDAYLMGESEDREVPEIVPRDQWGRPLIAPVGIDPATCINPPVRKNAKRIEGQNYFIPYTRCSTMAKALDDQTAIEGWRARKASYGVSISPGLQAAFRTVDDMDSTEGKKQLNALVESAMEVSGANSRRMIGSAVHKFSERWDKFQPLGFPREYAKDLAAYILATHGTQMQHIERFVVNDRDECAGTPDRITDGKISDLKTGNDVLAYGQLSIAMQLANYADSSFYNPITGERTEFKVDPNTGVVWHLPAGEGVCYWYDVDLNWGRESIGVAKAVRELRKVRGLFTLVEVIPSDLAIHELIEEAPDRARLEEIWSLFSDQWMPEYTEHVRDRLATVTPVITMSSPFELTAD